MKFKAFIIGLVATFGLPWLLVVVIPFSSMRTLDPVPYLDEAGKAAGVYLPKRDGRVTEGSLIYRQEGCYHCHTQLVRPTYAGNDVYRDEWAGLRKSADYPDTRRETLPWDFDDEQVAAIGFTRTGPDLANLGRRLDTHLRGSDLTPTEWVLRHLYNPRDLVNYREGSQEIPMNSKCPSKVALFKTVSAAQGRRSGLPVAVGENKSIIPTDRARALASYLVSLKRDTTGNPLPDSLNNNPEATASE